VRGGGLAQQRTVASGQRDEHLLDVEIDVVELLSSQPRHQPTSMTGAYQSRNPSRP
jgi:hypothetical protein